VTALLLLARLDNQRLVNVRNDTTTGNRCLDQSVELFVTSDSKLQKRRSPATGESEWAKAAGGLPEDAAG
jgi:hypothetical protein